MYMFKNLDWFSTPMQDIASLVSHFCFSVQNLHNQENLQSQLCISSQSICVKFALLFHEVQRYRNLAVIVKWK